MKTIFEFPEEVREFTRKKKIKTKEIEERIMTLIDEDLMGKNYNVPKLDKIRIVVNGISFNANDKVFISPKKISRKKPLRIVSSTGKEGECSVYYLIFKDGLD
jgi:hypothetical protein